MNQAGKYIMYQVRYILFSYLILWLFILSGCDNPEYGQTIVYQKQVMLQNVTICGQDCGYGNIYPLDNISIWRYKFTCINDTYTLDVIMDIYQPLSELYYQDDCMNITLLN